MAIDFTFSPEVENARQMIREFLNGVVKPAFVELQQQEDATREDWSKLVKALRTQAKETGYWLPHMPEDVGGMGLGVTAVAAVSGGLAAVSTADSNSTTTSPVTLPPLSTFAQACISNSSTEMTGLS